LLILLSGCTNKDQTKPQATQTSEPKSTKEVEQVKQLTEQEKALLVSKIKADFINEFHVKEEFLAAPLSYDLNGDGQDEIVMSTEKQLVSTETKFVIGRINTFGCSKTTWGIPSWKATWNYHTIYG